MKMRICCGVRGHPRAAVIHTYKAIRTDFDCVASQPTEPCERYLGGLHKVRRAQAEFTAIASRDTILRICCYEAVKAADNAPRGYYQRSNDQRAAAGRCNKRTAIEHIRPPYGLLRKLKHCAIFANDGGVDSNQRNGKWRNC